MSAFGKSESLMQERAVAVLRSDHAVSGISNASGRQLEMTSAPMHAITQELFTQRTWLV